MLKLQKGNKQDNELQNTKQEKKLNNTALLIVETYTNEKTPKTTKIYGRHQSLGKAVARAKRGLPVCVCLLTSKLPHQSWYKIEV